jgi:hypothetical protein
MQLFGALIVTKSSLSVGLGFMVVTNPVLLQENVQIQIVASQQGDAPLWVSNKGEALASSGNISSISCLAEVLFVFLTQDERLSRYD